MNKPVAIVDIGSNSVRLVVFEGLVRSPATVFNEKVTCGLGRRLAAHGDMGEHAITRAVYALKRFRAICTALGVSEIHAVATAAAREASDGAILIAVAEKALGCEVIVLSGRKEAELASAGILAGFRAPDGLVGDLGGGSLELVDLVGGKIRKSTTTPLGGLRLLEETGGDLAKVRRRTREIFSDIGWLGKGADRPFYAVGGTWRAFGRLHMGWLDYPLKVLHEYRITSGDAIRFARMLQERPLDFMPGAKDVGAQRREIVPIGAVVLRELIQVANPSSIVISAAGIREGLHHTLLAKKTQRADALLTWCEMLSDLRSVSPAGVRELLVWLDDLFDLIAPKETAQEARLRRAATFLGNAAWRAHPDYRGEQVVALIENGSFSGVTHPERAALALMLYYRYEGVVKNPFTERFRGVATPALRRHARLVSLALRAAHVLSAGAPGVLRHCGVQRKGAALVLSLPKKLQHLDGERLHRRFAALARAYGCRFAVAGPRNA